MGGFDPALAALDVEQAPAGLAIADPPDDAGLGAIDDRGVRTRRLAHRADAAGDARGARAAEQPRRPPRTEEPRGGKESGRTCKIRGCAVDYKKTTKHNHYTITKSE